MATDAIAERRFYPVYPLWYVADEGDDGKTILAKITATSTDGQSADGVAILTDSDLAERFINRHCPTSTAFSLPDRESFLQFVDDLETNGILYVGFDPEPTNVEFVSVSELQSKLR